jgi:hypothetical protein
MIVVSYVSDYSLKVEVGFGLLKLWGQAYRLACGFSVRNLWTAFWVPGCVQDVVGLKEQIRDNGMGVWW